MSEKNAKEAPTIEKIIDHFRVDFNRIVSSMVESEKDDDSVGGFHVYYVEGIEIYLRESIEEMLDYLEMEEYEGEDWFGDDIGYNNAVKELNQKIDEIRGEKEDKDE